MSNQEYDEVAVVKIDSLERLKQLGEELMEAEALVTSISEALDAAKSRANQLKSFTLPELMSEVGIDEFKTSDGAKITLSDFFSGSLPKDPVRRAQAIEWLDDHSAGHLVKTEVSLIFGREEREESRKLLERLDKAGYQPQVSLNVHAQTLVAFVREAMRRGDDVDTEKLGVHVGRVVKYKAPK